MDSIPTKPMDLKEWAYTDIKRKILNNFYKEGEQLSIEGICKELDVSRTPVREALLKLQAEGLVYAASRVGFFVKRMTREDYDDLFELRELIECNAASKAAKDLTDTDAEELRMMQQKSSEAISMGDYATFNTMETRIHELISSYVKNRKIKKILEGMQDHVYRERMYAIADIRNVELSMEEHGKIIEAVISRNEHEAILAMREHLSKVKKRLIEKIVFQE